MQLPVIQPTKEEMPSCFGKYWDRNAPECCGGPDPSYKNEETGSNVRTACTVFQLCGTRTSAMRVEGLARGAEEEVRRVKEEPKPFNYSPRPPGVQSAPTLGHRPFTLPQPQVVQQFAPPPQPQPGPYAAQNYQLNYVMPGYLSHAEVQQPGESPWSVLFREIIRAVFKSIGHTTAHFFDSRPLRGPKQ